MSSPLPAGPAACKKKAPTSYGQGSNPLEAILSPGRPPLGASGLHHRQPHLPESPLDRIDRMAARLIDQHPSCPASISRVVDALVVERDCWISATWEV